MVFFLNLRLSVLTVEYKPTNYAEANSTMAAFIFINF